MKHKAGEKGNSGVHAQAFLSECVFLLPINHRPQSSDLLVFQHGIASMILQRVSMPLALVWQWVIGYSCSEASRFLD